MQKQASGRRLTNQGTGREAELRPGSAKKHDLGPK